MKKRSEATHKSARRRTQGRPTHAEQAVGPDALIRAAHELLELLPPAKVTRAAVARHAGVDPSLIRYYFSDRASLLLAVVDHAMARGEAHARAPKAPALERLREHIACVFDFNAKHPFFHRLLVEEIASSDAPRAREAFHRLNQSAIGTYSDILKQGAREKTLRRIDPVYAHIAVIGLCEYFLSSRAVLEDAFGKGSSPRDHAKRYADAICDMLVDGIRMR